MQENIEAAIQEISNAINTIIVTKVNTNLNDYIDEGTYFFTVSTAPIDVPAGSNGFLKVIKADVFVKQIWFRAGTMNKNDHETYVRTKNTESGIWSNWTRYLTDKDLIQETIINKEVTSATSTININNLNLTDEFEIIISVPASSTNSNFSISFNNVEASYNVVRNFANGTVNSGEINSSGDVNLDTVSIPITMRSNAKTHYKIDVSLLNDLAVTWQGGSISDTQEIMQTGYAYNNSIQAVTSIKFMCNGTFPAGTKIKIK